MPRADRTDRTAQANRMGRGGGTGGVWGRRAQMMGADATVTGCRAGAAHSRASAGEASSSLGKLGAAWLGLESLAESAAFERTQTQRRHGCWPSKVLLRAAGMESPARMNPANIRDHATDCSRAKWRPRLATSQPTHHARDHRPITGRRYARCVVKGSSVGSARGRGPAFAPAPTGMGGRGVPETGYRGGPSARTRSQAPMAWKSRLGIQRRRWGRRSARVSRDWPRMMKA